MLLINLIAARRAERRKLELIRGVLLRAMFAVGAIALGAAMLMTFSIQSTKNRIRDVDAQTVMLQDTVQSVERLKSEMAVLQPRVTTLLLAQNSTNRWRAVLQEVSSSLPQKAWITSFTTLAAPQEGFVVTGQTLNHGLVGSAMMQLQDKPYIKSVDLHYTQAAASDKGVNFELAGGLEPMEGAPNGK
ncbi:MAG TPA: PilN domain-containing protein [Armatimonadota bacterium]|jgi:Tfp pilus assembly protein PilN